MPTVPTVTGATVRPAASRARPPLQRPSVVNVAPLGQGLVNASTALERADLQISQITLSEADAEFTRQLNEHLYTGEEGYFKKNGKDAVDGLQDAIAGNDAIRDNVAENFLKTGMERRIFAENANKRIELARVKMAAHSFDARQTWDLATSNANMLANLESAASDPSPENLRLTRVRIEEEAANIARLTGMPPEQQAEAVKTALSGMYRAAIETALVTDLAAAKALLDQFQDDILHDDEQAIRKRLKEHTTLVRGAKLADDIAREGGTLSEQLDKARKRAGKDIEVRDGTIRRLTSRFNQAEANKSQVNSEVYNDFGNSILNGEITTDELRTKAPGQWEDVLTQSQREHLLALEATVTSPKVTNWARFSELTLLPGTELAKIEPIDERLNLADTEYKQLLSAVKDARDGITGTQVFTAHRQLVIAMGSVKKLETTKGQLMAQEFSERLQAFENEKGKKATELERSGLISQLMVDIELPNLPSRIGVLRSIFGIERTQKGFQVQTSDIPRATQVEIVQWYQKNRGRLPSDNEMIDAFIFIKSNEQAE